MITLEKRNLYKSPLLLLPYNSNYYGAVEQNQVLANLV